MLFCVLKSRSDINSRDNVRDCLKEEIQAYKKRKKALSILQAVSLYVISKITLYNKINGCRNQVLYDVTKQLLTLEKKKSIENLILKIQL